MNINLIFAFSVIRNALTDPGWELPRPHTTGGQIL